MKRTMAILALCVGAAWSSTALADITRHAAFTYDGATGLLTQETIEPNSPQLQLQTNTVYDAFGNKTSVTKSGYRFDQRQILTTYDSLGQFVTSTTKVVSDNTNQNETDIFQYDSLTGRLAYHLDPNGLPSMWYYDYLGRKTLEVRPDGTRTAYSYDLCNACVGYSVYAVTATPLASNGYTINGPISTIYFDSLDREVGRDTQGFDGSTVRARRDYDSLGNVLRTCRPFFVGVVKQWTNYTYDVLGRVLTSTAPDGSITRTVYQGLAVTQTNANNETRTVTKNARGDVIQVTDARQNNFYYTRDALGNLLSTKDANNNVVSAQYDLRGRKVTSIDPDLGTWTYTYDALDEVLTQIDANGNETTFTYDQLGRTTKRVEQGGGQNITSQWTYDTAPMGIGRLASAGVTGLTASYQRNYGYDQYSRPNEIDTYINNVEYTFTATYDTNGHLSIVNYPSGSSVQYSYNSRGYANQLADAYSGNALWTLNSLDAEQHITQETAGNGVVTNQGFSVTTGRLLTIEAALNGNSNNALQNLSFTYDNLGNLTGRTDYYENFTESFQYDQLNRLTQASINTNVYQTKTLTYDAVGNILTKSDVGTYSYPAPGSPHPHAVIGTNGAITTSFSYDDNGNQASGYGRNVTWTPYNKPKSIQQGSTTISFLDGPEHQRFMQMSTAVGNTLYFDCFGVHAELAPGNMWNDYFTVGNVMVGERVVNAATEQVTQSYFFHTDHLGSISVVTDQNGAVVQRLSYDAWGKTRLHYGADGQPPASPTTRGFTGEEELSVGGLVHLNGRVYDPTFGRMISADPTVPDPLDPQAWNRYSYVGNDPLTFTDPTGFSWLSNFFRAAGRIFSPSVLRSLAQIGIVVLLSGPGVPIWAIAVAAAITAAAVTGMSGGSLGDMLRAGAVAGVTVMAFSELGALTSSLSSDLGAWGVYVANIAGHAGVGCLSAAASGGHCGPGALAAAVGTALAPIAGPAGVVGSAIAGGLASRAGGGKFEDGAVTGAFSYLFSNTSAPRSSEASPSGTDGPQPTLISGTDMIQVPTQVASNGVVPVPNSIYETIQDLFGSAPLSGSALKSDPYHALANDFRAAAIDNGTYFFILSGQFPGLSLLLQYGVTPIGFPAGIVEYMYSIGSAAITHQTYIPHVPVTGWINNWDNTRPPFGGI
jgi:RHS repeat-associated protein